MGDNSARLVVCIVPAILSPPLHLHHVLFRDFVAEYRDPSIDKNLALFYYLIRLPPRAVFFRSKILIDAHWVVWFVHRARGVFCRKLNVVQV